MDETHSRKDRAAAAPRRRPFDDWAARERTTQEDAQRRLRRVRQLRVGLPALALTLIVGLVFVSRLRGVDDEFRAEFENLETATDMRRWANPSFYDADAEGLGVAVVADIAEQNADEEDVIRLTRPRATLEAANAEAAPSVVTAARGVYRMEAATLDLSDDVEFAYAVGDDAYILRTRAARVSIDDRTVVSDAGVEGSGPAGAVTADRVTAYEDSRRLVFDGAVRIVLEPDAAPPRLDAKQPPEAEEGETQTDDEEQSR